MTHSDCLIVGAGPAGCIGGIILARAGWQVTIIEQHRFPRGKVCGECISSLGIDVLRRNSLAPHLPHPVQLSHAAICSPRGREAKFKLGTRMWGLSRSVLDEALLEAARAARVTVWQPARCESIDAPTARVVVRDLLSNRIKTIDASYVMLADGKRALAPPRPPATADLGIKAHFEKVNDERETISLFGFDGHYCGLAPIEDCKWNLAMSIPAARVRQFGGDVDAIFADMLKRNASLSRRLANARRIGGWMASALPRHAPPDRMRGRVIPIGNAAGALEPIFGEGIGLAMRSAELAAMALVSGRRDRLARLPREFARLWTWRRFTARATALAVSRPSSAELLVAMLNQTQSIVPAIIPWLGISRFDAEIALLSPR
jgi:flavin-dependent dehydrogenase